MISNPPQTWPEMMESLEKELILDTKLETLDFPYQVANIFIGADIKTVRELSNKTPRELSEYRNLGKRTLREIRAFLAQYGLRLKDDQEDLTKYVCDVCNAKSISRFCCEKCRIKWRKRKTWESIEKKCLGCSAKFSSYLYQTVKYCSLMCFNQDK